MNIVAITSDRFAGSVWHRIITPLVVMARVYDDVKVSFTTGVLNMTDEQLSSYQVLSCHFSYWDVESIERARRLGVKVVYDFDDYWHLEKYMSSFEDWKHINMKFLMLNTASYCDLVTCTTPILADSLKKELKVKVEVIRNGIDTNDKHWQIPDKTNHDKVHFGYVSGFEHYHDLQQIFGCQTVFDVYVISSLYPYVPNGFKSFEGRKFIEYPSIYNDFDAVLAPLIVSRFNRHKSELKMIEAGFKKKPIIVSNVEPFTQLISPKNCLTVNKPQPKEWIKQMRKLSDNLSLREDLAEALYEDVRIRYNLENIAVRRRQLYESL